MTHLVKLILLLSFMTMVFDVEARPTLGPPSIKLKTEISNIAQVKLEAKSENKLHFLLQQNIHNEATEKIVVRTTQQVSKSLQVGQSYIIGYIAWQVNKPRKEVVARDGGAVLMSLPGAEPAIFNDVAEIRDLFSIEVAEALSSPESLLPVIKTGISSDDFQIQNFFVTELVTRKSFLNIPSVMIDIQKLIVDADVDWRIKYFILANEGLKESQLRSSWFEDWATATLLNSSTQFDLSGSEASLIVQLLKKSEYYLHADQTAILERWINSNNTGVVESMLDVLKMMELDDAIKIVNARLQQTLVDESMRVTLNNYLTRLNNQKKQQQKK